MLAGILGSIATSFVGTIIEKVINGLLTYFERAATIRQARDLGAAEQLARDSAAVAEAEAEIHGVQAEERDADTTKKRLDDATF